MAGQLKKRKYLSENLEEGLKTFTLGLASKMLLANPCNPRYLKKNNTPKSSRSVQTKSAFRFFLFLAFSMAFAAKKLRITDKSNMGAYCRSPYI